MSKKKIIAFDIRNESGLYTIKENGQTLSYDFITLKNLKYGYALTDDGRVWSYHVNRFLKPFYYANGLPQVKLYIDGKGKKVYVHRLMEAVFNNE